MATVETVGAGPRIVWILHGVFGSGRNWRTFAGRWATRRPDLTVLLPDLRGHGAAVRRPPPHTLNACAADLDALPRPDWVVGHSFGGKVALAHRLRTGGTTPTAVLDIPPGPAAPGVREAAAVLGLLRSACAGTRAGARAHLLAGGLGAPVVDWLLTSWVGTRDEGRFAFDLDAISAELQDTLSSDLWPAVDCGPARVLLVEAGRGGRWTPAERARARRSPTVRFETLPDAGHWLQVDAPDKLGALLDAWIGP